MVEDPRELLKSLDYPADSPWVAICSCGPINRENPDARIEIVQPGRTLPTVVSTALPELQPWIGYSFEVFGVFMTELPATACGWELTLQEPDGTVHTRTIQFLRVRVWKHGDAIRAEVAWRSGTKDPARGWHIAEGYSWDESQLERAGPAMKLAEGLREILTNVGGRRKGSGEYDADEERFFGELGKAAHEAVRQGERVTYTALARHGPHDWRTYKKYVEKFEYNLAAIETEAIRCGRPPVICRFYVRRMAEFKKKRR
jgi:hypothetical protein